MSDPAVLFVCLGNICRSPTAEAVFRHKAAAASLKVRIDSAGTMGYHTGSPPDERSEAAGVKRGYDFDGLTCRRVKPEDFEEFDYILGMDHDNVKNLREVCPEPFQHKIALMMDYADVEEDIVPDPYYGGLKGFDYVLDLIESASDGLIQHIKNKGK